MKILMLGLFAGALALTAVPAAEAKTVKHVTVIKSGGHDRGLHRGWSHSKHWGARRTVTRTRVMIHR